MNKQQRLTIALGSAFAAVASLPAHATGNPFAANRLDAGYQVAQADMKGDMKSDMKGEAKAKDGKAPQGNCGQTPCGAESKMPQPMNQSMNKAMDQAKDKAMPSPMDKPMDKSMDMKK